MCNLDFARRLTPIPTQGISDLDIAEHDCVRQGETGEPLSYGVQAVLQRGTGGEIQVYWLVAHQPAGSSEGEITLWRTSSTLSGTTSQPGFLAANTSPYAPLNRDVLVEQIAVLRQPADITHINLGFRILPDPALNSDVLYALYADESGLLRQSTVIGSDGQPQMLTSESNLVQMAVWATLNTPVYFDRMWLTSVPG
jgi:hypothetical protein